MNEVKIKCYVLTLKNQFQNIPNIVESVFFNKQDAINYISEKHSMSYTNGNFEIVETYLQTKIKLSIDNLKVEV